MVEDYQERDVSVFAEDVNRFAADQKNLNLHLGEFKKTLRNIVPIKE